MALNAEVSTVAVSGRGVIRNYGGDTAGTMPMLYTRTVPNAAGSSVSRSMPPDDAAP